MYIHIYREREREREREKEGGERKRKRKRERDQPSSMRASLAARYLEKKTRRFSDFLCAPPLPVSPG